MSIEALDREKMQQENEHFEQIKRESETRQNILESETNKKNFESMPVEQQLETIMLNYTSDKGRNYADIHIKKYVDEKFYEANIGKFHRAIREMENLEKSSNYYEFVDNLRNEISGIIDEFINNIRPELKTINQEYKAIKETLNSTSPLVQNINQMTYGNNESKSL